MNKTQLLTCAIMTVNDSNKRDYYDNFVPFVKEALRTCGNDTISANEVKENIKSLFDLDLPINVVNTILRRRLRSKGYIKLENQRFIPDFDKLQDSNFTQTREKMILKHDRLISEIISYSKEKYNKYLEVEETEKALESFIEKYQLSLLEASFSDSATLGQDNNSNEMDIIISSFVLNCEKNHSLSYEYLIEIVKGTMLKNVIYYNPKLNTIDMKFKGTEVYFDSSFLIYALGLSGKARQEPCIELINMLRDSHAILRVFRHNIEEIIGILEWCKNNLTSNVADYHGTINYFISNGYGPSDVERIIYALENEIEEKLRIKIVETVGFDDYQFVISEQELENVLQANVNYPRKNALERDVQSVSAIVRLRKDRKSFHVESCRAVFITTNLSFTQAITKYFYNEDMPKIIPPVLHDSTITNLVWLKNPSKAPDFPSKRLIAECYAATAPKEHLWKRYIETLNIIEKTDELNQKDIVLLRYTPAARELLVEKTMGDENAITIGTVQEILDEIKNREQREYRKLEEEKNTEIEYLRNTLRTGQIEAAAAIEKREKKVRTIAEKRAKYTTLSITLLISIIIGIGIYMVPIIQNLQIPSLIKLIVIVILTILPTILGLLNISLFPLLRKVNDFFILKYENAIKNKYL